MSKNRLIKYERILKFQQQQLDLIKQQIGSQRQLIDQLTQHRIELEDELTEVAGQFPKASSSPMYYEQISLTMVSVQKKINAARIEIASADEKLDHLLHTFREQNKQLKSWEKLVERETDRQSSAARLVDMHLADERFLANQFVGGQQ